MPSACVSPTIKRWSQVKISSSNHFGSLGPSCANTSAGLPKMVPEPANISVSLEHIELDASQLEARACASPAGPAPMTQ